MMAATKSSNLCSRREVSIAKGYHANSNRGSSKRHSHHDGNAVIHTPQKQTYCSSGGSFVKLVMRPLRRRHTISMPGVLATWR